MLPGEVWQVSKQNSQYFRSYLRKTTGGPWPPSGTRVNLYTVRWKGSEASKQTKHTTRKLTPCWFQKCIFFWKFTLLFFWKCWFYQIWAPFPLVAAESRLFSRALSFKVSVVAAAATTPEHRTYLWSGEEFCECVAGRLRGCCFVVVTPLRAGGDRPVVRLVSPSSSAFGRTWD